MYHLTIVTSCAASESSTFRRPSLRHFDSPFRRLQSPTLYHPTSTIMSAVRPDKRRRLDRTPAACDLCKSRKVKCDGLQPCSYCKRKDHSDSCTFSGPKSRQAKSSTNTPANRSEHAVGTPIERRYTDPEHSAHRSDNPEPSTSPTLSRTDQQDTAVPLEARLLRDAQGKVIFIGDCAPLSFLQTVRHLIATDGDVLPVHATRDSFIEAVQPESTGDLTRSPPPVHLGELDDLLGEYYSATSGLVDLCERDRLHEDVNRWAAGFPTCPTDIVSAVYYLILAIGCQENDDTKAEAWFNHAKKTLMANLTSSMHLSTVQGFTLLAVYLLRAFQPNGAYLHFCMYVLTLKVTHHASGALLTFIKP